ncbi:interleukin-6 receptor subunit beta-like isoform X2 [Poecilia reticulata]|uniref:interleukin-6 receptor subunit beta-like isoform X2 n=1 Tax=Poecilia reticulata TaxID=8081 RepID=UPI0004A485F4|nr:PREDICTED: interleukin-6 receptor subunit beta-like isoform X2 [Poecilia reticulata]
MYMSLFSIFVVAALFVSLCDSFLSKGQHVICDVSPKDLHVVEDSSVELVCQTSCSNHGKIFWTLNGEHINESLSKTINATHTVLSLRNFTQSSAAVQCHSSYGNQLLGGVTIRTYSKPKNITCVLHYDVNKPNSVPKLFTCSWKHRMDPLQTANYTILNNSSNEICKSQVASCTHNCTHLADDIVAYMYFSKLYTIKVRAKTQYGETDSDPYVFDPHSITKINPPKNLKITPSSEHLSVKWTIDEPRCQVKYYKTSEPDKAPEVLWTNQSDFTATIEEVESCINYNVSVRCASERGLWSEWSPEKTALTKLSRSRIRMRLWRKVAEPGKNGKRKVHLMWKGIPSTCREAFTVKQVAYNDNTTTGNYTYTSCGSSSCDVDVDHRSHRLYLTVSDSGALLDSVYVPAVGDAGLPQVWSIKTTKHRMKGVIQVSWNVSEKPISSYIIDWTHDGRQYAWKETTFTNATLFGLLHRTPYSITVTPLFNDITGHSIHANPFCSSIGVPEHIAVKVEDVDDKSAFVKWYMKSQYTCSDVDTYTIFYEAQGLQQNVSVSGSENGVWLKDLKPKTHYNVRVEATGDNETDMSSTVYFITNKFDPRLVNALTICGFILVFLVLSIGLTCAIQWKKFNDKPVPNPRLSTVAKWLTQSHEKVEGFFQPPTDQIENQVVTEETQRNRGAPLTPVRNGNDCDPSFSSLQENEPEERFSETSETQLLSSPEGSMVFSSSQSSPYRSQDNAEPLLPQVEKPSKTDLGKKQEKTQTKSLYISLNMFEQNDVR